MSEDSDYFSPYLSLWLSSTPPISYSMSFIQAVPCQCLDLHFFFSCGTYLFSPVHWMSSNLNTLWTCFCLVFDCHLHTNVLVAHRTQTSASAITSFHSTVLFFFFVSLLLFICKVTEHKNLNLFNFVFPFSRRVPGKYLMPNIYFWIND